MWSIEGIAEEAISGIAAERKYTYSLNFTRPAVKRIQLGRTAVDLCDRAIAVNLIASHLRTSAGPPLLVASANLDHIHHFGKPGQRAQGGFDPAAGQQWLVLLDGMPMVWAASLMTLWPWEPIAGSDVLPEMLEVVRSQGARVGFLGGREEMHQRLRAVLANRYPDLQVAGMWAPSREELNEPAFSTALAEQIREAEVDLLVVGLGKPRQEDWLARYGAASGVRVGLAFGAAADFLAGMVCRAPRRMQRFGLEWFYRLMKEPRRLSRRYLIEGPPAVVDLIVASSLAERPAGPGMPPGNWGKVGNTPSSPVA